MDWARAKSIILFLLLVFNIFLLANIIGYARDRGIPAATIQNTEKILKSRGITLECDIPRDNGELPRLNLNSPAPYSSQLIGKLLGEGYIRGESDNTYINGSKKLTLDGGGLLTYTDKDPAGTLDITRAKTVEKYVRDFLSDKGLAGGSFVLDGTRADKDGTVELTYLEKYKGYLVYDNYAKVAVSGKGVTGLAYQRRDIAGLSTVRLTDMAAAYQVLLANFDGSSPVTIIGIDIGYKFEFSQDATSVQSEHPPAWRVRLKGTPEPLFFSAVDGKPIK